MNTNGKPRDRPDFYSIVPHTDGTVDVYLRPDVTVYRVGDIREYDVRVIVVRGVNPNDPAYGGDLEGYVRAHYSAWMEAGEAVDL